MSTKLNDEFYAAFKTALMAHLSQPIRSPIGFIAVPLSWWAKYKAHCVKCGTCASPEELDVDPRLGGYQVFVEDTEQRNVTEFGVYPPLGWEGNITYGQLPAIPD